MLAAMVRGIRRGFFPPLNQEQRSVLYGADSVTVQSVAAIDRNSWFPLAARFGRPGPLSGIRVGDTGAPDHRYNGDLGPIQQFSRAQLFVGANTAIRPGFNRALPGTAPSPAANSVLISILRNLRPAGT